MCQSKFCILKFLSFFWKPKNINRTYWLDFVVSLISIPLLRFPCRKDFPFGGGLIHLLECLYFSETELQMSFISLLIIWKWDSRKNCHFSWVKLKTLISWWCWDGLYIIKLSFWNERQWHSRYFPEFARKFSFHSFFF